MNSIYSYINYRRYLSDFYEEKKKTSKVFSFRYFASKAEIRSPVLLRKVIDGKRNISESMTGKFAKGLGLNPKETLYFTHLVLFNQATTAIKKQEHYANLREMMNAVNQKMLTPDLYDYFNEWYNPVVRELLCLADFGDDLRRLACAVVPRITVTQAKKSVDLLRRLNLVLRDSQGKWVLCDKALATDSEVASMAVRSYNQQMAQLAMEAIERFPKAQRHISGLTLTCSDQLYDVIVAEIDAFRERIVNIVNHSEEPQVRVLRLNVQLFPLSDDVGKPSEGGNS